MNALLRTNEILTFSGFFRYEKMYLYSESFEQWAPLETKRSQREEKLALVFSFWSEIPAQKCWNLFGFRLSQHGFTISVLQYQPNHIFTSLYNQLRNLAPKLWKVCFWGLRDFQKVLPRCRGERTRVWTQTKQHFLISKKSVKFNRPLHSLVSS